MVVQVCAKHKDLLTSRELGNPRQLPEKETITVLSACILPYNLLYFNLCTKYSNLYRL